MRKRNELSHVLSIADNMKKSSGGGTQVIMTRKHGALNVTGFV